MVAVLDKAEAFVQTGITWEQFKAVQRGFESIPNVRLNYCEGELLQTYKLKGVPEVWFWQQGKFTLHRLQDGEYVQIAQSQALAGINLSLLSQCMMLDSRLEALKRFRDSLQK